MKILVIFTGGTIGSTVSNGYIGLGEKSKYRLLSLYQDRMANSGRNRREIEFVTMEPYTLLSENSTGKVLQQLVNSVQIGLKQAQREQYSGIIVTHGTDTLAYSAAMLGYYFAACQVPIVLVSSNYILEDPRSNGLDNFVYGVEFIGEHPRGGVYVSYRNSAEAPRIHMGTRILGHQAYSDTVCSMAGPYGWFDAEGFHCPDSRQGARGESSLSAEFRHMLAEAPALTWDAPIQQIVPFPGMSYPQIQAGTKAILHHTYHAGTICSETPGLREFFAEVRERQISVFLTGADPDMVYESTRIFEQLPMQVLPIASPVSMYVKLWLILNCGLHPEEWMGKEIAGEF